MKIKVSPVRPRLVACFFRSVAQSGRAIGLGPIGRRFESCLSDFVVFRSHRLAARTVDFQSANRSSILREIVQCFVAEWRSLVARWAHIPEAVGSNPASAIVLMPDLQGD